MKNSIRNVLIIIIIIGILFLLSLTYFLMQNDNKLIQTAKKEISEVKRLIKAKKLYVGYDPITNLADGYYCYSIKNGYIAINKYVDSNNKTNYKYGVYIVKNNQGIALTEEKDLDNVKLKNISVKKEPTGLKEDTWEKIKLTNKKTNSKDKAICIKTNKKIR